MVVRERSGRIDSFPVRRFAYRFAGSNACRAPTVMADVNDLGRLVREPNAGLSVTPGDSKSLLQAIDAMLKADKTQLDAWSQNGQHASEPYLWSNIVDDLLKVYQRVRT